jgi:putative oxidoreductase
MIETNLKPEPTPLAHRVSLALLLIRLSIFLTMIVWVIDKLVRPEHGAAVLSTFYGLSGVANELIFVLGVIQLIIMLTFVVGYYKKITYGLVLLMHAASTLVAWPTYLAPFNDANILFYAAWPMLAACFTLYYLRDLDTRAIL